MKSFLHGKKSASISALAPASPPPSLASVPGSADRKAGHGPTRPTVEVVKEGDKVVRVYVTCGCGERIELECLYPAGA